MGMLLVLSCAVSAGLGTFLHGYNAGMISHIITNEHFNIYFKTLSSSPVLGAIVSVFAGGATLGSFASGLLLDRYGRRKAIQVGAVISILGCMLQAASVRLAMMLLGRIVSGFAVGMMSVGVPVYLAEIAHPKTRGFLSGWVQLSILFGFVFSSWVGYAASNVPNASTNPFTWRFPLAIAAIPAVFITFALQWLPESPRYLVRQGMTEAAFRSMMKMYHDGENRDIIQAHVHDIARQWKKESLIRPAESDWVVMWKVPVWRKRIFNAMIPSIFTQFTGINILTYYINQTYSGLGLTASKGLLLTSIYHTVAPIACLIFMLSIADSIGRKKPVLLATLILPAIFLVYAGIQSQNPDGTDKTRSTVSIALMFAYNLVFCLSWGPVGWMYLGEMIPLRVRGKGSAVAAGVGNWMMNVLISQVSPQAIEKITWRYYIVFAVFNLFVTLPCIWFFMKEPKNLSLEEVDRLWEAVEPENVELARGQGDLKLHFGYGKVAPVKTVSIDS